MKYLKLRYFTGFALCEFYIKPKIKKVIHTANKNIRKEMHTARNKPIIKLLKM